MRARIGLSSRAEKDWSKLDDRTRRSVMTALNALASDPPAPNIDQRPLVGHAPWRRIRVGGLRVIFRPLSRVELDSFEEDRGYLVERVIQRRDLERATKGLR